MDFSLNEEQMAIRQTCREFAEQEIKPIAEEMDAKGMFPYALVRQMGELGLLGLPFPEEMEARGLIFSGPSRNRGDLAWGCVGWHYDGGAYFTGCDAVCPFGSHEQKERYLVPLARGEQLWAFGLTEPEAGSDSGGTQTRAILKDGHWHINGTKAFITNAGTDMTGGVTITAVTGVRSDGRSEDYQLYRPQRHSRLRDWASL